MNERIQGVNVYGGGPRQHYVFRAQEQRERRQFIVRLLVLTFLAAVFAWCMRSAFASLAEPPQAAADIAPISQVQPAEQDTQQPDRA